MPLSEKLFSGEFIWSFLIDFSKLDFKNVKLRDKKSISHRPQRKASQWCLRLAVPSKVNTYIFWLLDRHSFLLFSIIQDPDE